MSNMDEAERMTGAERTAELDARMTELIALYRLLYRQPVTELDAVEK